MNECRGTGKPFSRVFTWLSREVDTPIVSRGEGLYKYITCVFTLFVTHVRIRDVAQVAITAAEYKKSPANKGLDVICGEAEVRNSIDVNCEIREALCHVIVSFLLLSELIVQI